VNIFIGRSQRNSIHVHSNWNGFSLIWAPVHHLIPHQRFSFSFGGCSRPKGLLPHKCDLHTFHFDLNQMKVNSSHNDVFQMVETFVVLEIDVQAILYANLHFHWYLLCCLLYLFIGKQDGKVYLFCY